MLMRVVSGVLGVALAIWIVRLGGIYFLAAAMLLALGGLIEFYNMALKKGAKPFRLVGIVTGLILVLMAYFNNSSFLSIDLLLPALTFSLFCLFTAQLVKHGVEDSIRNVGVTFFGVFYVGGLMAHFVLLRNIDNSLFSGESAIWFGLVCTWSTDTFAYFVGRSIGKKPLVPNISPKKTVAGFWGGLFGSALSGFIFSVIIGVNPLKAGIVAVLLGFVAQVGDLFESALKRDAGVKDSGNVIPGHGGVLDRFDSALFVLPLTYYLILTVF